MAKRKGSPAPKVSDKSVLAHARNILFRPGVDGEISILKLSEIDSYFTVHGVAAKVWLAFDGVKSIGEIKKRLLADKSLKISPAELFYKDVDRFCHDLIENRLATLVSGSSRKVSRYP